VGEIPESTERLLRVTRESLYAGINAARSGNRVGDISSTIQEYCESRGYFIVKDYIGHGVGRDLHEDPEIPNFGVKGKGPRLVPGMTIAIEPMINSTTDEIRVLSDKWTVVEANGNPSAHFEHTILITDGDPFIMTVPPGMT
jgi:methionyl aminopeptidase